ncbi:MAG: hypothetical protein FJ184_08430 [Gammaproteobacteria bacterium]|nr:hypothetical protein [Gammaproteobacteria bacterium]
MTPATIIREAQADGVRLALSPAGTIKATGNGAAVDRWLAAIREHKAEIIEALKVGAGNTATISRWWLIHYPNRDPVETVFDQAVTHAELMKWNRDAIAASPMSLPTSLLSAEAEAVIREWLTLIGETNEAVIDGVLALSDSESHRWVLEQMEKMR